MSNTITSLPGSSLYPASSASSTSVARTSDAALPAQAVELAANEGIVATLGGASSSLQTYDAAGLLNTLVSAGSAPAAPLSIQAGEDTGTLAQDLTDAGISALLPGDPATAGIYGASGGLQSLPGDSASNWATALKTHPELASVAVGASFAQGVIAGIDTSA